MKHGASQVDLAMQVLRVIEGRNDLGVGARELVAEIGVSKSSLQRVLVSLDAGDLLSCDRDGKYRLNHRVLALAHTFSRSTDFHALVTPAMQRLEAQVHETVVLSVESNRSRVTIAQCESLHELRYRTDLGRSYPLWGGASGWLLAYAGASELIEGTVDKFEDSLRERGIGSDEERRTRAKELRQEIEISGERGWALSRGTWAPGGFGLSVPLRMRVDRSNAALTVYGPEARVGKERYMDILDRLKSTGEEIDSILAIRQ